MAGPDALRDKLLSNIRETKGHIIGLEEAIDLLAGDLGRDGARNFLAELAAEGAITIAGEDVFLSSESYMPAVKCLICDGAIDRKDLVPFYREKHYPFVSWGFHRECLEGGALDEMLASGLFRLEDGKIFPDYEYGEGKGRNPITIAIKFLRSDEFLYALELKSEKE